MSNQRALLIKEMGIRSYFVPQNGSGSELFPGHRFFIFDRQPDFTELLNQKFSHQKPRSFCSRRGESSITGYEKHLKDKFPAGK
jgi:hypothetical protein